MPKIISYLLLFLAVCFVVILYHCLAGGNFDENFFITAWIVPVAAIVLIFIYGIRGIAFLDNDRPKWSRSIFWVLVVYFCLPILLNGASLFLKWVGFIMVGSFIFEYRYVSLVVVPLAVIIGFLAYSFAKSLLLRKRFSRNAIPSGYYPIKTTTIAPSK